jgi:AraC-like DNA-binding protein
LFSWPERALEIGVVVLHELFFLHLLIYSALSLLRVRNYQLAIVNDFASEAINLRWLQSLLIVTLFLYLVSFLATQVSLVDPTVDMRPWHIAIQFILVFTMYAISYKSISQPQIFFQASYPDDRALRSKSKYSASSLDQKNAKRIQDKLIVFMVEKKAYLNPQLSLEAVSKELNESRYHISQVINENLNSKFNDFVNGYRLAEFKQLVVKPRRRKASIESLARLSGFNSKTSFHAVFKRATGQTPSKFYKDAMSTTVKSGE